MCTIMTTTGSLTTIPEFEEAFARTKYRGPDDTRFINTAEQKALLPSSEDHGVPVSCTRGIMGFHRLSIMGLTDVYPATALREECRSAILILFSM